MEFQKSSPFDLVLKLSLLFLLMFSGVYWFTRIPLATLALSGFINQKLTRSRYFWFTAFCFVAFEVIYFWYEADNHKYLTAYWFLSLSFLVDEKSSERRDALLALHGRCYLALCMGFAVLWKCLNQDFTDSRFFEFTLLTDDRFQYFTHYLTQLPLESLKENQFQESQIFSTTADSLALIKNTGVETLAVLMTWFTIFIEMAIAVGFAVAPKNPLTHLVLMAFILATYPVASVIGFAWLLILLALSICQGEKWRPYRIAYCVLFVITQAFRAEFGELFETFGRLIS